MNRRLSTSKKITLGAMVTALSVLCLYAAAALPVGNLAFYFLSSVCIYVLTCEQAYASAILAFAASVGLSFLILPDKIATLYYIALLGHYGIIKTLIDSRVSGTFFKVMLKLLYCDLCAGIGLYVLYNVFQLQAITLPEWLPLWLAVVIAQVGFILFDILYNVCISIYVSRIRPALLSRR